MRIAGSSEAITPYTPDAEVAPAVSPAPEKSGPDFADVLRGVGSELDRGEALSQRAIHGGTANGQMSPDQLLALQAGIYRYSEAVDLVTKLVDRGTQAVKTTLQNQ
ncbi:MAG TPA: hypothetical protein VGL13_00395 [Polyangiaceae bacterium]|jgi:hypothetical protein